MVLKAGCALEAGAEVGIYNREVFLRHKQMLSIDRDQVLDLSMSGSAVSI